MADEAFAQHRLVDDAENRARAVMQRNQSAPGVAAGDKRPRAVDRIEDPGVAAGARFMAPLFAQNAVRRPLGMDKLSHRVFRAAVSFGHGVIHRPRPSRALVDHRDLLAEKGTHYGTRFVGQTIGESECGGVDCHGVLLSGRGPKSTSPAVEKKDSRGVSTISHTEAQSHRRRPHRVWRFQARSRRAKRAKNQSHSPIRARTPSVALCLCVRSFLLRDSAPPRGKTLYTEHWIIEGDF